MATAASTSASLAAAEAAHAEAASLRAELAGIREQAAESEATLCSQLRRAQVMHFHLCIYPSV